MLKNFGIMTSNKGKHFRNGAEYNHYLLPIKKKLISSMQTHNIFIDNKHISKRVLAIYIHKKKLATYCYRTAQKTSLQIIAF